MFYHGGPQKCEELGKISLVTRKLKEMDVET